MSKNVTKLISPWVLCTSFTNRVPSLFDRFNAYCNCMNKIVTKLIYHRVRCTNIRNRVLSWFDRLKVYCNCMSKNVTKLYISASSVHKYHKSCSLLIWPFYGLLQQYEIKMSQNWNLCQFCAQVSQNVFLADLTVLQLITTVWAKMSQNSCLGEFCAQASQIRVPSWFDRFTAYYNCMRKNVKKLISPLAQVSQNVFLADLNVHK